MTEIPEFYKAYVAKVQDKGILKSLEDSWNELRDLIANLTEQDGFFAYADGKWTIKDVLQHIIDCERIMSNRALRFARADKTSLPGFDENHYVPQAKASNKSFFLLLEEFDAVRKSSITLFKGLDEDMMKNIGEANGHQFDAEAQGYIMAGHCQHHIDVLKERYLPLL